MSKMSKITDIHSEIADLYQQRRRRDISEEKFQSLLGSSIVMLCQGHANARLEEGESILAEHHVVVAHFKLTQSVLQESDQEAIGLFATEKRLIQVSLLQKSTEPVVEDGTDHAGTDAVPYGAIRRLVRRREIRRGELMVGCAIIAIALVFREWLQFTSTALIVIGILGALHSVLLPMRWVDVEGISLKGPIRILAVGKKSGRRLMRLLQAKINEPGETRCSEKSQKN